MTTEHELNVDRDIKLTHLDLAINWLRMISARGISPVLTEQEMADIDFFLASQQGEHHSCKNCLGVDPESCMFKHPEQAEGAQGEREVKPCE